MRHSRLITLSLSPTPGNMRQTVEYNINLLPLGQHHYHRLEQIQSVIEPPSRPRAGSPVVELIDLVQIDEVLSVGVPRKELHQIVR